MSQRMMNERWNCLAYEMLEEQSLWCEDVDETLSKMHGSNSVIGAKALERLGALSGRNSYSSSLATLLLSVKMYVVPYPHPGFIL